jgi:hypothetical protein
MPRSTPTGVSRHNPVAAAARPLEMSEVFGLQAFAKFI